MWTVHRKTQRAEIRRAHGEGALGKLRIPHGGSEPGEERNTAGEMLSLAIKRFWGFGFFQSVFIDTIFFANFLQKLLLQNSALEGVEGWERDLIRHHLNSLFPAV